MICCMIAPPLPPIPLKKWGEIITAALYGASLNGRGDKARLRRSRRPISETYGRHSTRLRRSLAANFWPVAQFNTIVLASIGHGLAAFISFIQSSIATLALFILVGVSRLASNAGTKLANAL